MAPFWQCNLLRVCGPALLPLCALAAGMGWGQNAAAADLAESCPVATATRPLPNREPRPQAPPPPEADAVIQGHGDYRDRLRSTPHGWPRRDHWCVWIEPSAADGPAARWDQAWRSAVQAALDRWGTLVPITTVPERQQAQVLIERRRPPLRGGRASHGRAELALVVVDRQQIAALEPLVTVQISPGQRAAAIEATALHELGHAFGLWGHSDRSGDAMAAVPGPEPVRELSERDRASFRWLQRQPGLQLDRDGAPTGPAEQLCVSGSCGP
jgi:hypothetical protein